ncbi:MAG: bifunctional phosphopantothenoylcysteine decarboxylase/phosphopantothenate--cysteine ligase CoaBC [Nitrospinota bacterium]|nr:bifunctional phosphopantothenoylcysteine decarboxylase/phosphopantothenate--cysteine ligase CoaBC [Nitrospinota bacterium]
MAKILKNKKIVLGVSGGIAAYKAVELLRLMVREGAEVYVVMTANAKRFVAPLTFEALSGQPVYHEVFESATAASMEHIRAAENADFLVVAPATAGSIGKMANGLADDALSNLFLAFQGPVLLVPAMNEGMYSNPAVRENIEKIQARGIHFVNPEHGELACGVVGQGRLAEPLDILDEIKRKLLSGKQDFDGVHVLVTAGPTHEALDPVRYLSNPSSGKMGFAVAEQARDRGAKVTLVSGPTHLPPPKGVQCVSCRNASEMNELIQKFWPQCDVLVMAAAVGDFKVKQVRKEKIKKQGDEPLHLKLVPTPDILKEVSKTRSHQLVVGFAAETENLVQSASDKLKNKNLDLIVANDISAPGIGFQSDANQVTLIDRDGIVEPWPQMSKLDIANRLLDKIQKKLS